MKASDRRALILATAWFFNGIGIGGLIYGRPGTIVSYWALLCILISLLQFIKIKPI